MVDEAIRELMTRLGRNAAASPELPREGWLSIASPQADSTRAVDGEPSK